LLVFGAVASAGPVSLGYTASGSPGSWQLDFTVTNNMNALGYTDQDVYFIGVYLGADDVITSPTGWVQEPWNPFDEGGLGPNINFDNTWITATNVVDAILPGGSSSTFVAGYAGATLPTTINWFAYTFSETGVLYTNGGDVNGTSVNPLFVGTLSSALTTPEPSLVFLVGAGLLAMAAWRRGSTGRLGYRR